MLLNSLHSNGSRQLSAVLISSWLSFYAGFTYGFSAVLLPELRNDGNFLYDENIASWIAAISPLSMVIGCIFSGSIIDRLGRKIGHVIITILAIISWVTIAFATNFNCLLVGRFIGGLSVGSTRTVSLVYIGEISDPKYRTFSLICPSFLLSMGILTSHIIGEYVRWKISSYIYIAIIIVYLTFLLFLKESPLWLISKGNIDKGVRAFRWFRGKGNEAEAELKLMLQRQSEKTNKFLLKDILSKRFLRPLFTSILLAGAVQFNGLNPLSFYLKEIIADTVKTDVDSFTLMMMIDVLRILTFIIFFSNKFIPRKILFLTENFCCSVVLIILFALLYFVNVFDYVWLSITLIILYIIFASGVVALAWSFIPELFSGNLRGLGSGISGSTSFAFLFVFVKISPSFIVNYGVKSMYIGYSLITIINTSVLCFLLPETNKRTLQDIEDSYDKRNVTTP